MLWVGPVTDGWGDFAIDDCRNGFIVRIFEAKWPGVLGSAVGGMDGVGVEGAFGEEDSKVIVEAFLKII